MSKHVPQEEQPTGGWLRWAVAVAAVAIVIFIAIGLRQTSASQPTPGNPAPEIELSFYEGYEWDNRPMANLSDMQGSIVVLNFWASWCAPCREEAPYLQQIYLEYQDRNVEFLGVAWSDMDSRAHDYLAEYGVTYANAPDLALDAQELYHFRQVPETFFIDENGVIQFFHAGPLSAEQMRAYLDQMVSGG